MSFSLTIFKRWFSSSSVSHLWACNHIKCCVLCSVLLL